MDFKSIQAKFEAYVKEHNKESKTGKTQNTTFEDTSIFLNHDNLGKFIDKEYGFDAEDMTMNLKTLLNTDIKNGQFVGADEYDVDDIELESASDFLSVLGKDDSDDALSKTAKKDIGNSMIDVLNDVLSDKDMKKIIDSNKDGKISKKEIQEFVKSAAEIDGNAKDLSLEDILAATDAVKNADKLTELLNENTTSESENEVTQADNTGAASGGGNVGGGSVGGGGGSYGGGGNVGGSSGGGSPAVSNASNQAGTANLDNMNKEQLQAELETANTDLSDKQDALSAILDGSDSGIKDLQDKVDDAYDKWQEELEKVDKDMAKEVDDLNTEITDKESKISAKEGEISDAECALSDAKTSYDNAVATTANLQNILSSLQSQSNEENDLSGQIAEVEAKIAESQAAEQEAQAAVDEAEANLDKLKGEKDTLQGELDNLNDDMTKLQDKIAEKYPEIKQYQEDWNKAKEELTTQKASAAEEAKAAVVEAQERVNEVQTAISNYEDKETTSEYTVTSLPKEVQQRLDAKLGAGFTARLEEICKKINCDPEDMLRVMCSESGLNPQAGNPNGGAMGLIQIMPDVARNLGTSTAELAQMSGVQQLDYVEKCFGSWLDGSQKVSAGRLYAFNFLPAYANRGENEALTVRGEGYYNANSGLDTNKDGQITIKDLDDRLQNIDYMQFI